jgi:hypothetical protein
LVWPGPLAFGRNVTILDEPVSHGDQWVATAFESLLGIQTVRLTDRLNAGTRLIVVAERGQSAGGYCYLALLDHTLEAAAETIENAVLAALARGSLEAP